MDWEETRGWGVVLKMGSKSLLFGAHQFAWHPFTVFLAWCELYGLPNWKETVCIFIHDWGYWGCENMEGNEGKLHPLRAAHFANKWLDPFHQGWGFPGTYMHLCLFHSRTFAADQHAEPSKLCWADKLCVKFDPWWIYLPRVTLTGEIKEYRREAHDSGLFSLDRPAREWYDWARERMIRKAHEQDERPPYQEGS